MADPSPAEVDRIFAEFNRSSPGCALAVMRDGSIVYSRGYGMADLEHKVEISPPTVFHAASLAKQFTAMAVMLLVGQGRLGLEDDVREYVPELRDLGTPVLIRHLLQHTSGLRDQWTLLTMAGWRLSDDVVKSEDVFDLVTRMQALNFRPGTQYLYSNTGYTLAARIVERAAGQSFRRFAETNIFHPLKMTRSWFRETHGEIVPDHAYGHRRRPDGAFETRMPNYDLVGPTNLVSTVEDLASWDGNFASMTVGGAAVLTQMQTPGTLTNGDPIPYGLGLILSRYRGLRTVEHDGRDPGYRAHFLRFPDEHFSVACLCNLEVPDNKIPGLLVRKVADLYLADRLGGSTPSSPVPEVPSPPDPLLVGAYWDLWREELGRVSIDGTRLRLGFALDSALLRPLGGNRFHWDGRQSAEVEFVRAPDGQAERFAFRRTGARDAIFAAMPAATASPEELPEYAGQYYSAEIDTTYRIVLRGEWLAIERKKYPVTMLEPAYRDAFSVSDLGRLRYGTLRFTRNGDGGITGFVIGGDRLRRFRFVRTA